MQIDVRGDGDAAFGRALVEFKKRVKRAGILEDLRKHEYHLKPSLKRKLKRQEAFKRRRREANARARSKTNRSRRGSTRPEGERNQTERIET
jgi:ribosomal protein S21